MIEDIDRLQQSVPQVTRISPCNHMVTTVAYDNRSFTLHIDAEYASGADIFNEHIGEGRWFNAEDELKQAHVAVVAPEAKRKLFSTRLRPWRNHPHQRTSLHCSWRCRTEDAR